MKPIPEFFVSMYYSLKEVGFKNGYAITIHGSLTRDFDLIAIPWIKAANSEKKLIKDIMKEVGGEFLKQDKNPSIKPHGRHAYAIWIGRSYIDISVMPKI